MVVLPVFRSSRGLRQDDLLSPLLFIMVSEVFSKMIRKIEGEYIQGSLVGFGECRILCLQFANDIIIFCNANECQLGFLRCIFCCFEVVLGLNINLRKSELFHGGDVLNIDNFGLDFGL